MAVHLKTSKQQKQVTAPQIILTAFLSVYFLWTLRFAIRFNSTNNLFNRKQRLIHNILIWVIPFIWVMIINTLTKPTPGSVATKRAKGDDTLTESGFGVWASGQDSNSGQNENGEL